MKIEQADTLGSEPVMWAGTQESFDVVLRAQQKVSERMKAGTYDDPNGDYPPIWERRGSTAVINISGSLVDGEAGWGRYFGVLGYDDVAKATIEAASDPDVKTLMFHINSPGGSVDGVMDCGNLLNQISKLKPSAVYTSSQMSSGGYWLGSSIEGTMTASPTASVGSIGVLMVLTDYVDMFKQAGIGKSIMRAGKNKALINPFEKPTEEAKADLQGKLDDMHALFRAQVAKGRPNLSADQLLQVTDGSEFMGKRAKAAGLVDNVANMAQALKLLDSQNASSNTPANSKGKAMKITELSPEQRAAISAGATPASLGLVIDAEPGDEVTTTAAPEPVSTTAAPAPVVAAAPAGMVSAEVADLLKSQLSTAQAGLVTVTAELTNLKASTQTMQANSEGLLAIARDSIGRMAVGLGGSDAAAATMDSTAAIAEHARISAVFKEKFKIGGVAVVTPAAEPVKEKVDPRFAIAAQNAPKA